jgi:hypothetical protein
VHRVEGTAAQQHHFVAGFADGLTIRPPVRNGYAAEFERQPRGRRRPLDE